MFAGTCDNRPNQHTGQNPNRCHMSREIRWHTCPGELLSDNKSAALQEDKAPPISPHQHLFGFPTRRQQKLSALCVGSGK